MEQKIRQQKLSLKQELFLFPKQFSFDTAAYILEYRSRVSFGKEINVLDAPFQTKSVIAFYLRATEIEKIAQDEVPVIFTERLALAGLNAPLPDPYGELILRKRDEQNDAIVAFFDIFHARLLGISHQISRRRYLSLQNDENSLIANSLSKFFGEEKISRKYMRLAYLFWTKERSASGLTTILSDYFGFDAHVDELYDVSENRNNIKRLGQVKLNHDAYLGKTISMQAFGVKICITHEDPDVIFDLLSDENKLNELKYVVQKYIGQLFICVLKVTPPYTNVLKFGCALGKNSWLAGKHPDWANILL